jgi:hypothetical protein
MNNQTRLPDFLIVGTMKSGTSSLADYLKFSPAVHIPSSELHYFDNDANFAKGPNWYAQKLTEQLPTDKKLENVLLGEKTPTYSFQPNCAQRIKTTIPDVKLIWIFRDPVKRSFSNYLHARKKGGELLSFRKCVQKEKERSSENIFKGYTERSKYILQIERFLELFDISAMHFMLFEDLVRQPLEQLNNVADFLGVSRFQNVSKLHSNQTVMPFLPSSLWLAQKVAGYNSTLYTVTRKVNSGLGSLIKRPSPKIPNDVAEDLAQQFEPFNQRLAALTGLDLSVWNSRPKN